jgi:FtsP/CotA-like multicopper oxidase with cupredoxin domain
MKHVSWKLLLLLAAIPAAASANQQVTQTPLPGGVIPKYVEAVPQPARVTANQVTGVMRETKQRVLPPQFYPTSGPFAGGTFIWSYQIDGAPASWPAATFEQRVDVPTTVRWVNQITGPFPYVFPTSAAVDAATATSSGGAPVLQKFLTVDQTIHWADPNHLDCMFRMPVCEAGSNDPCCKPYGYPSWPGFPVAYAALPRQGEPQPGVVHLHGAEVPSVFDGHPEAWFTPIGQRGPAYASLYPVPGNQAVYQYPNSQEPTTLWFHDHSLGTTRHTVFAGLAGFYLLRDARDTGSSTNPIHLPAGPFERELMVQDRSFDTNGQWLFPDEGVNPTVHPFWIPEFFGDVIVVNGKSWPYLQVEQRRYRLRFVNASNARFYRIRMSDGRPFWQIGTDGGFLDAPVRVDTLLLGVAERADVIVDFSNAPVGSRILVTNDAAAPFPDGDPVDPATTGQVMQFRVVAATSRDSTCDPAAAQSSWNACRLREKPIVRLSGPDEKRQLILREIASDIDEPLEVLLNNTKWSGLLESTMATATPVPVADSRRINDYFVTELPQVGSTEVWEVANLTEDAHPIHVHLIQFQVLSRRDFDSPGYLAIYEPATRPGDGPPMRYLSRNADGAIGGNFAFSPFYLSGPMPPAPNESGWKDTVIMLPGTVTRIIARWAPQDVAYSRPGQNLFSFDPTRGPGYVWHCHILDHEDNEMMRPYAVSWSRQAP